MARCWFVTPVVIRLPLSDGQWIDVKRDLSIGEQEEMFAGLYRATERGRLRAEPVLVQRAKVLAYVVAWSLTDQQGAPVPVSVDAYKNLYSAEAREIIEAIETHEDQRDRERTEEKKRTPVTSSHSSPSAAPWDGAIPT